MQIFTPNDERQAFDEFHPDFFARVTNDVRESFITGHEHEQAFGYYGSDDEALFDGEPVLDQVAFEHWQLAA